MHIDWYFDFVSPFAYLQSRRFVSMPRISQQLDCHPVVFGAILDRIGQIGPAEIAGKRELTYRQVIWRAREDGIPLTMPGAHPFNSLPLLRLALAADRRFDAVVRIFAWVWQEGRTPDDSRAVARLARELGVDDWAMRQADPQLKAALRAATDGAIEAGVFGVPMVIVAGQRFWGDDMTPMLLEFCENPQLFDDPVYAALIDLPVGARRRNAPR